MNGTVEPIKSLSDIAKIKRHLLKKQKHRDYMLFVIGINVGLRIGDLLTLKIEDLWHNGEFKEELVIKEQKTQKIRQIAINGSVREAVNIYLNSLSGFSEADYLFKSRKSNKALTAESCHRIISGICAECGVKGNYGTHSLRKTFAYQLYMANSDKIMILEYLMKLLNHSTQQITLRYIGLEKETLDNLVNSLNL